MLRLDFVTKILAEFAWAPYLGIALILWAQWGYGIGSNPYLENGIALLLKAAQFLGVLLGVWIMFRPWAYLLRKSQPSQ